MQLSHLALTTLRACLSQPGWAKTSQLFYLAGHLLVKVLPESTAPDEKEVAAFKAWAGETIELTFANAAEQEACLTALRHAIAAGSLIPGKINHELMLAFNEGAPSKL